MNCPIDNTPLAFATQQGVEIDYCPKCRGVWLDREKLDALIERGGRAGAERKGADEPHPAENSTVSPAAPGKQPFSGADIAGIVGDLISQGLEEHRQSKQTGGHEKPRKKRGLLGQLLGF